MMLSRRQFKNLLLGAGLSAALTVSCTSGSTPEANTTTDAAPEAEAAVATEPSAEMVSLRLAQNLSPISGVAIVAKDQGFFEAQGLDVEVSNFTSGKQCLETVMGGAADIATTAEAPTTAATMASSLSPS